MAAANVAGVAQAPADRRGILTLTVAHLVNDANQSALPAIIPWLVSHRGLSLAVAATLVLAMNLSSSIVQPLFGHFSDRKPFAWVIPCAVLLACLGTAMIGYAASLPLMFLGALISGVGVAAFHPEGSRYANYFAGANRATAMSWFTTGGYLGFALGPILVTPLLLAFGLHGAAWLVLPGAIVAVVLVREMPRFAEVRARVHHVRRQGTGDDDWRAFALLTLTVGLRSMTFLAAVTFLPIFAITVTHVDTVLASVVLALMLLGGVAGTVWGGALADRIDRRRVVNASLALTPIFAAAIAVAGSHAPSYAVLVPLAIAFGVALGLSAGVVVVIGQEYLPKRIGVASGVTLGLAVTVGGLMAPVFGALGDRDGLVPVFAAIAVFGVLAFIASLFLPKPAALGRA